MFRENPELMDAYVWVYFHSSTPKYNRIECWGPLNDAAKVCSICAGLTYALSFHTNSGNVISVYVFWW